LENARAAGLGYRHDHHLCRNARGSCHHRLLASCGFPVRHVLGGAGGAPATGRQPGSLGGGWRLSCDYVCSCNDDAKRRMQMALFDDEPLARPKAHVIGQDLSLLSVGDLDERIGLLRAEIERLEAERKAKGATKTAAEALFRRT